MLLLAAFAWLARVTAGNVGALPGFALSLTSDLGGLNGSYGSGATAVTPITLPPTVTTPVQQELLSSLILIGVMLGYILWRVRKVLPREDVSSTGFFVFLLVSFGVFITLLISGRAIVELLFSIAQSRPSGSGILSPEISTIIYTVAAGIAGVSLASLILFLARVGRRRTEPLESDSDEIAKGFTRAIDGAVYSIRTGSDFRMAVLRCYKSLCDILQDGGASNAPEMTAREFEVMAVKKLAIPRGNIQRMTELFEKARYSQDTIDEADARDAEASLLSLEREVRSRPSGPGMRF
jgi:hypothetical protein